MRILSQSVPEQGLRRLLVGLAGILVFILGAYELAQYILADDVVGLAYIALAAIVAVAMSAVLKDWRLGAYIFFGWIFFEDLARKYLGNNMLIYFGKDILVGMVYISFVFSLRRKQAKIFQPPFRLALYAFIWFGVIQIFNQASSSIFYGLMGIKLYFYYVPLMFIGYALIETEEDVQKFYPYLITMALIVASLGIAQSIIGPTFLNPSHLQEDIRELSTNYRVAPLSGAVIYRPNSVFVSTGRYTFFLVPAWLFTFGYGFYLLLRRQTKYRALTFLTLGVLTLAVVLGGSRGAVMWTLGNATACLVAFFWGCPWQKGQLVRILRTLQKSAVIIIIALAVGTYLYPDAVKDRVAFYLETLTGEGSNNELAARTGSYPIQNFLYAFDYERWPYGYGIGTASLGTQYVARIMHATPMGVGVESGFGTLVLELGVFGLLLWLAMGFSIVICGWRVVRRLRGTVLFPIGFAIFWYSVLVMFFYTYGGFQSYEDFILNALFWLSMGILFRLTSLPAANPKEVRLVAAESALVPVRSH